MLAELSCRLNEPDRARKTNEARDRWLEYKETAKN